MTKNIELLVLATPSIDILIDSSGQEVKRQLGGPAYYIKNALANDGINFWIPAQPMAEVEILLKDGEEFGRVTKNPKFHKIPNMHASNILISTVLREINLPLITNFSTRVFLDVQGFVRDGSDFGKKVSWEDSGIEQVACLKATVGEIAYLPKAIVNRQKKEKLLLVTDGSKGATLFAHGQQYNVKPNKTIVATESIGAGDTFFASFVASYITSDEPQLSLDRAAAATERFLSKK